MSMTEAHAREVGVDPGAPQLGLALSGGGFRASLFHLGVLARLAERGLLRRVEVLSTVSGGSIIGALYYLYLRQLLVTRRDEEIADADYVAIVKRIEETLVPAIARNFRARTTSSLRRNFRMARLRYSRSTRMGELYDEYLYLPAWNDPLFGPADPPLDRPVEMRDLTIVPRRHSEFTPRSDNAGRRAKVPILLLNATTLNTGHNFRFEVVRLGEPEHDTFDELDIDKNARLGRSGYLDGRPVTLGAAVAASAAVPTVFHPVPFLDLYAGWRVELVDGGNHDNQGVQGLLDRGCSPMFVSDASGQMDDSREPSTRIPAVAMRSGNAIYGDRLREEQLLGVLRARRAAVVHLKRGLPVPSVEPQWAPTVSETESTGLAAPDPGTAAFGVHENVQRLLARVRTDLDAFSEVEATALALDGYLMTAAELDRRPEIAALGAGGSGAAWAFDRPEVRQLVAAPSPLYLTQLDAARAKFFRILRLGAWPPIVVRTIASVLVLAAVVAVAAGLALLAKISVPLAYPIGAFVALLALVAAYALPGAKWPLVSGLADVLATRAAPAVLALPLWLGSKFSLYVTTPWFLRLGRVDAVWRRSQSEGGTTTQTAP